MKTLLIGAGGIAFQHCNALTTLGVEIAGVYDVCIETARRTAAQYNSVALEQLEEEHLSQVDMVHLLTPPSKRLEYARWAMEHKKHIFCEKPMAMTLDDAFAMEMLAKETGVLFMVAFTQRFREGYRLLKALLDSGELGELVQIFSYRMGMGPGSNGKLGDSWRTDRALVCGMTIESLSHDIDFMLSLAGSVNGVQGIVKGTVSQLPEFDNNAGVLLQFNSGAMGTISASWGCHIPFNMRGIIGSRGSAILEGDDLWNFDRLRIKTTKDQYERVQVIGDVFTDGTAYLEENRYFLECIEKGIPPACDAEAGRRALEVSLAALASSKQQDGVPG